MDGLPKQFLSSLKILFDILDENRTGFIRLRDIECRWSDDGVRGLPTGIVDGLKKVTPSNGLLSFEKFVSGLKLVLNGQGPRTANDPRKPFTFMQKENFVSQPENHLIEGKQKPAVNHRHITEVYDKRQPPPYKNNRTISQSQRHPSDSKPDNYRQFENENNQPKVYSAIPVTSINNEPNSYTIKADVSDYPNSSGHVRQNPPLYSGRRGSQSNPQQHEKAPAVPPRTGRSLLYLKKSQSGPDLHHSHSPQSPPPAVPPRENMNSRIISDLRNWQREWTVSQSETKASDHNRPDSRNQNSHQDPNAIYANIDQFQRKRDAQLNQSNAAPQKATVRRHGSGRRHTLTSGIDQNMMKRMKQLDEEVSMLRAGLSMLESARDWYLKQLSVVSDKQAMLGKVSYNDNSLEAHQERMSFQRAQISEVNQRLRTLLESSEKGFPLHMNLAMPNRTPLAMPRDNTNQSAILVDRNRRLMEEMNQKSDKIVQLENEKASLVRDLFEARAKHKAVHDDTTFM